MNTLEDRLCGPRLIHKFSKERGGFSYESGRDAAVSATRGTRRNAGETRRKGKPLETVGPQSYGN